MKRTTTLIQFLLTVAAVGFILAQGGDIALAAVAKTGQQLCWDAAGIPIACAGTGQDGEHQAGVVWPAPRFTDLANGTVLDNLTGLVWLQDAGCLGSQQWTTSLSEIVALSTGARTCTNYTAGTHGDWRLPNVREFESLWDYSVSGPAVAQGHPFLNLPGGDQWSSTTSVKFRLQAWTGHAGAGIVDYQDKMGTYITWAVRGPVVSSAAAVPKTGQQECWDAGGTLIDCAGTGQDGETQAGVTWPIPRFTDLGNGTVLDNLTGLIWLKDADCFGWHQWASALSEVAALNLGSRMCENYVAGAQNDWRLPNIRELTSLWDYGVKDPSLPAGHPFVNTPTPGSNYWSSTSVISSPSNAWEAETYSGRAKVIAKAENKRVWAVRGGTTVGVILSDGFESGDTSAWSNSVP